MLPRGMTSITPFAFLRTDGARRIPFAVKLEWKYACAVAVYDTNNCRTIAKEKQFHNCYQTFIVIIRSRRNRVYKNGLKKKKKEINTMYANNNIATTAVLRVSNGATRAYLIHVENALSVDNNNKASTECKGLNFYRTRYWQLSGVCIGEFYEIFIIIMNT